MSNKGHTSGFLLTYTFLCCIPAFSAIFPPCSAQLAEQANSVPSINSLDFVMESLALGHTIMSHR